MLRESSAYTGRGRARQRLWRMWALAAGVGAGDVAGTLAGQRASASDAGGRERLRRRGARLRAGVGVAVPPRTRAGRLAPNSPTLSNSRTLSNSLTLSDSSILSYSIAPPRIFLVFTLFPLKLDILFN